jgi:hypothetical protein
MYYSFSGGTKENHDNFRIVGAPVEIWNRSLLGTNQKTLLLFYLSKSLCLHYYKNQ